MSPSPEELQKAKEYGIFIPKELTKIKHQL